MKNSGGKNIIWDWSGVVRDPVNSQMWIVNQIFKKYGLREISTDELRENWRQPPALFYQKYLPRGYREGERVKLFRELELDKDCPKHGPFPEVVTLIRKCKERGYFLAVVSSDFSETLLPEVKEYRLGNVFDEIVTDANDKLEAVQKIVKENNLNTSDTFFVGDSNHEIDVAKEAGIKSVAVTWGFTSERKLMDENPDFLVHNSEELTSLLFK